jgi:hypothetical protein
MTARITEVDETYDLNGLSVSVVFGKPELTLAEKIRADVSSLETAIQAEAGVGEDFSETIEEIEESLDGKLDANLGAGNVGKFLAIAENGDVEVVPAPDTVVTQGPFATTDAIPTPYDSNDRYLVGAEEPYDVYYLVDGQLIKTGTTAPDLDGYVKNTNIIPTTRGGTGATSIAGIIQTLFPNTNNSPGFVLVMNSSFQNPGYESIDAFRNTVSGVRWYNHTVTVGGTIAQNATIDLPFTTFTPQLPSSGYRFIAVSGYNSHASGFDLVFSNYYGSGIRLRRIGTGTLTWGSGSYIQIAMAYNQ